MKAADGQQKAPPWRGSFKQEELCRDQMNSMPLRLILVPSLMSLIGQSVWWLPAWLDRLIPHFVIETEEEFEAESALIEDVPVR